MKNMLLDIKYLVSIAPFAGNISISTRWDYHELSMYYYYYLLTWIKIPSNGTLLKYRISITPHIQFLPLCTIYKWKSWALDVRNKPPNYIYIYIPCCFKEIFINIYRYIYIQSFQWHHFVEDRFLTSLQSNPLQLPIFCFKTNFCSFHLIRITIVPI